MRWQGGIALPLGPHLTPILRLVKTLTGTMRLAHGYLTIISAQQGAGMMSMRGSLSCTRRATRVKSLISFLSLTALNTAQLGRTWQNTARSAGRRKTLLRRPLENLSRTWKEVPPG